jgi:predicted AAA+ superfamily ATPase
VYISDSGITTALLQLKSFEQAAGHPTFGSLWETTVLANLKGHFPNLDYSFYRTNHGAEIDFVLSNGDKTVAVECKASVAPKLTSGNYASLKDIKPDICFVAAPVPSGYPKEDGIEVVSLHELVSGISELLT